MHEALTPAIVFLTTSVLGNGCLDSLYKPVDLEFSEIAPSSTNRYLESDYSRIFVSHDAVYSLPSPHSITASCTHRIQRPRRPQERLPLVPIPTTVADIMEIRNR